MSTNNKDRPNAESGGADNEILVSGDLPGFSLQPSVNGLKLEELSAGYQSAIRRVCRDPNLYRIFRKVTLSKIHQHGSTSADKIEYEMKDRYNLAFCHYTRTLLGRLFQSEHPQLKERLKSSRGELDKASLSIFANLLDQIS